jgi:nitrogen-specific signal transduction histidine kinase/ActR/RegA family two-component response regulator
MSEKIRLESMLSKAQKMEAIGNLAGGIAHDFNNILFPIIGLSEMLLEDLPPDSPEHENAQEILAAGKRGGELVKQILTFSRQSEHQMIPVRIQQVLREVLRLSRSTIPSNIEIRQDIQNDCGRVMADPTQLYQIAMNLITNAYHAVELKGGQISVLLKEVSSENDDLADSVVDPGPYAMLSVADTGCGIDPTFIDKIFEPYFTTKEKGKGTGLGLAVVYGIVKKYGGDIKVYSELEKGTTFNVFIPLIEKDNDTIELTKMEKLEGGTERILLVDDEGSIVKLLKDGLERLGYHVTGRTSSVEALEAFRANPDAFDLVVTDMNMPNMTGDLLARELLSIKPRLPVIICTGFSERMNKEKAKATGIKGFLMKPVVRSELSKMIRTALERKDE